MNALESEVWRGLARLLTLLDRAPFSPTRGSADRSFWHYRSDKDHPSATFAQAAWPLALLASRDDLLARRLDPARRARLAELSLATLEWWASIQHGDGSFAEWFANERSHVATAFTTAGAAEAALALGERFRAAAGRARILAALERAAGWLERNADDAVANHAAGAVAALAAVDALLPGSRRAAAGRALARLLAAQDEEGWFPEYGGADPGYATVAHGWLGRAATRIGSPALDSALDRLEAFLAPWVNPDGSFGGEHGRRATRYAWLSGPALRARASPVAASLLARLLAGLEAGSLPGPGAFDDRYFAFFAFPDAVATLAALGPDGAPPPPPSGPPGETSLPRAGMFAWTHRGLRLVVGTRVGGALKIHAASGALLHDDCGWVGRLADGRLVASWAFGPAPAAGSASAIVAGGQFSRWSRDSPVARHPLAVALLVRTAGRVPAAARWLAGQARRRFTTGLEPAPIRLDREVRRSAGGIEIADVISVAPGSEVAGLRRAAAFAPLHVPSAPLWLPAFEPLLGASPPDLAALLRPGEPTTVVSRITLASGRARLVVQARGQVIEDEEREIP